MAPDIGQRPPPQSHVMFEDVAVAGISANIHASDAAQLERRLDALAATVCDADPRTKQRRRADACGALASLEERLACQCGSPEHPLTAERKALGNIVIHVLAEQATLNGTSDHPRYLPGFRIMPAESVRELSASAKLKSLKVPNGPEAGYRPTTRGVRCRPHEALPTRSHPRVEQQAVLPHPPLVKRLLPTPRP